MAGHLTNYERETTINFNETEAEASIFTHNGALHRKLEKLAQERPEECRPFRVSRWGEAVEYIIPKSWLKIHPPRILTDEQRAALAENARKRFLGQNAPTVLGEQDPVSAGEGKDTTPTQAPVERGVDAGKET